MCDQWLWKIYCYLCLWPVLSSVFFPLQSHNDVVIQSQRRQKDLCYYSFNILRAWEQLMAAEKYETFFFCFYLRFSYRLRCIIYEIERIECRMRIVYNKITEMPLDKPADRLAKFYICWFTVVVIKQLTWPGF